MKHQVRKSVSGCNTYRYKAQTPVLNPHQDRDDNFTGHNLQVLQISVLLPVLLELLSTYQLPMANRA